MASLVRFIERRLRLEVNASKSAVARSEDRHINVYTRGWYGFFGISSAREEYAMQGFDAHIRRRLRAIVLKHWKRRRTIARKLTTLGVRRKTAWRRVYQGRKSTWALSHDTIVHRGLRNAYFAERGLVSLVELHRTAKSALAAPAQRELIWE